MGRNSSQSLAGQLHGGKIGGHLLGKSGGATFASRKIGVKVEGKSRSGMTAPSRSAINPRLRTAAVAGQLHGGKIGMKSSQSLAGQLYGGKIGAKSSGKFSRSMPTRNLPSRTTSLAGQLRGGKLATKPSGKSRGSMLASTGPRGTTSLAAKLYGDKLGLASSFDSADGDATSFDSADGDAAFI
jgi:hypothetical protein